MGANKLDNPKSQLHVRKAKAADVAEIFDLTKRVYTGA
jgi:hypothetical protein